jgi:hypothetical protein
MFEFADDHENKRAGPQQPFPVAAGVGGMRAPVRARRM